jgi:hypothetical protein
MNMHYIQYNINKDKDTIQHLKMHCYYQDLCQVKIQNAPCKEHVSTTSQFKSCFAIDKTLYETLNSSVASKLHYSNHAQGKSETPPST